MGSYYSTPQTVTEDPSDPSTMSKCPTCGEELSLKDAYDHSISHKKSSSLRILKNAGEYEVNI